MYVNNETLLGWLDQNNGHYLPEIESGYRSTFKVYELNYESVSRELEVNFLNAHK